MRYLSHFLVHRRRRCHSQLSVGENARPPTKQTHLPSCKSRRIRILSSSNLLLLVTAYCSHCKLPLLIDVTTREANNQSRAAVNVREKMFFYSFDSAFSQLEILNVFAKIVTMIQ